MGITESREDLNNYENFGKANKFYYGIAKQCTHKLTK